MLQHSITNDPDSSHIHWRDPLEALTSAKSSEVDLHLLLAEVKDVYFE